MNTPETINLMDIKIDNISMQRAVDLIVEKSVGSICTKIAFVNADCFNISFVNKKYKSALQACDYIFADGIGVKIAGKMIGCEVRDNVNGTDLLPLLCLSSSVNRLPVFFLGSRPDVVDKMVDNLKNKYPDLPIAGYHHGYFNESDEDLIINKIKSSDAKILLVAFGAPKQELWIENFSDKLDVPVAMGVGGLFDFYSGRIPRAPKWMRSLGLEWVYRLMQEPGRMWRRYLIGNPLFIWRVWNWQRKSKAKVI